MSAKKKKIIAGAIIIGIILIIAIIFLNRTNSKKQNEGETETTEEVELSEVLEIEDIEKIKYEKEKTKDEIATKYITGNNMYKLKATVKMQETTGKMIYLRGVDNINVYQTEYDINKYGDKNTQVSGIIQTFEEICKNYMGIGEEYKETEQLYGESNAEFELPVEESIYNEGRLYSKTYKSEENTYDINFYKKDDKIICEFVRIFIL